MNPESDLEMEIMKLKKQLQKQQVDYKKAKKVYDDFKHLREEMGQPLRTIFDKENIIKGLRGEDFILLGEELERRRTTIRGNGSTSYW